MWFCVLWSGASRAEIPQRQLVLWSENVKSEVNVAILKLALENAESKFGKIALVSSAAFSYTEAFSVLGENNTSIDLVISALDKDKEQALLPVYFPLDRGLLGVRLCLISKQAQHRFETIKSQRDFVNQSVSVVLDAAWPDTVIMQSNQIPVITANTHEKRVELTRNSDTFCYSRSLIEIEGEAKAAADLVVADGFVIVYPLADILYFRQGASDLASAVEYGLEKAFQDGSLIVLFNSFYQDVKQRFSLYERKLFFLQNPLLSEPGRRAVNRFGIFSFTEIQSE
jgi:hypothetical protein